jgi:localization factor PodJL
MTKASSWMTKGWDEEINQPARAADSASGRSGADFERALRSLDRRLSEIAHQIDREQPRASEAAFDDCEAHPSIAEAIADIARGRRAPDRIRGAGPHETPERREPRRAPQDARVGAPDSPRNDAAEIDDPRRFVMEQVGKLRGEVAALSRLLGDFAPRSSVTSVEAALKDLADRIESQRSRGVQEAILAPVERLADDLRAIVREIDPEPVLRGLRAETQEIGRRLDDLRASRDADASLIAELARQIGETRSVMSAMASRLLPLDKLETRVVELTRRVESLDVSNREHARKDLVEVVRAVRLIVATEFSGALPALGQRLEELGARMDGLQTKSEGAKRLEELRDRIDEMHESLAARIDRDATSRRPADLSHVEHLLSQLAKKIDASLASKPESEKRFAELTQRIDEVHRALATRIEQGAASHENALNKIAEIFTAPVAEKQLSQLAGRIDQGIDLLRQKLDDGLRPRGGAENAQLVELVGQLAKKIDAAIGPRADNQSLLALAQQIDKLSRRLDREDQTAATLASIEQTMGLAFRRIEEKSVGASDTTEAARRAAADVLREASFGFDAAVGRQLSDLRRVQDDSGRRTQETLAAVQDTLNRVIERLSAQIDAGADVIAAVAPRNEPQPGAVPKAPPQPAPLSPTESETRMPLRPSVAALDDVLVERGRARPEGAGPVTPASPEQKPRAESPAPRGKEASMQADFIAAARRAAQQAAADAEAARVAGERRPAPKAPPKGEAGGESPRASIFQTRKRPLLLVLGALVMLTGAYQLARFGADYKAPTVATQKSGEEPKSTGGAENSLDQTDKPDHVRAAPNSAATIPSAKFLSPLNLPAGPAPSAAEPSDAAAPIRKQGAPPSAGVRDPDATPTGAIGQSSLPGDSLAAVKELAEQGDGAAQFELASRYSDGRGLPRDSAVAAQWFEKAARQGLAPAEYRIGSIYEKGVGVDRNYAKAREWYERAARQGNIRAMHNLAVLFAEGGDGKPDYATAAQWFQKAAEHGVRDSQYNLGILFARGLGVERNLPQSYMWFSLAAAQGDADAAKKRDDVASRLDSKELASAKSLAEQFRPAPSDKANNEFSPPPGGWELPRNSKGSVRSTKPKMSAL